MSIQGKKELAVAALQNGIVIDHIPCPALFKVVNILGIENTEFSSATTSQAAAWGTRV